MADRSETAHLRFLVGAGITLAAAPPFIETASNIGVWGMRLAQLLARQLATAGVELLVLPRPPLSLLAAPHAGRRAQLEAAFQLFIGNELRRLRLAIGDPDVVVSAHALGEGSAELRITLSTPFDTAPTAGFRWLLDPLDDLTEIAATIEGFLQECRLTAVQSVPRVLPDRDARGALWFPRAADLPTAGHA